MVIGVMVLATPKTRMAAEIIFEQKEGVPGNRFECFQVERISGGYARQQIQPFMDKYGIPCMDDEPEPPNRAQ